MRAHLPQCNRTKQYVPDLGEFLVMLSIADGVQWRDVQLPFFQELIDRNVKWYIFKVSIYCYGAPLGCLSVVAAAVAVVHAQLLSHLLSHSHSLSLSPSNSTASFLKWKKTLCHIIA